MAKRTSSSKGTFRDLIEEGKRKPGRPKSTVKRQTVYVELAPEQKELITTLSKTLPNFKRADIPDLAVLTLTVRMDIIRQAVSGRARELPEGITDMQSLYFLWDLPLPPDYPTAKWTSIRLSPQQLDEFGALQGRFNLLFGANRSEVFTLALVLFSTVMEKDAAVLATLTTLPEYHTHLLQSIP